MNEVLDEKKKIRVMLADDHRLVRQGVLNLLEGEDSIEMAGEAADGLEAVRMALEIQPDVVVMDIGMPHMNGIEATREILKKNPDIKIIALSMHDDSFTVETMLRYGARGYILKTDAYEELISAIHSVRDGENYLGKGIEPSPEEFLFDTLITPEQPDYHSLSRRECDVLRLVARGNSTKEIANELHISVKTADTHRQNIMNKLGLRSVAELTKFAIREGISRLDEK